MMKLGGCYTQSQIRDFGKKDTSAVFGMIRYSIALGWLRK